MVKYVVTHFVVSIFALAVAQAQVVQRNVPYGDHAKQVLDIYEPSNSSAGLHPAVLFIHGGGWTGMSKDDVVETHCRRYLEKGFVVVNVEYRLAGDALAPAAVLDVRRAAGWLSANATRLGIDSKRIVVSGNSAGGHLALMTVVPMPDSYGKRWHPAAIVVLYGITDVGDLLEGPNRRDYAVAWLGRNAKSGLPAELSPLSHLTGDLPPLLAIHGDADDSVPYEQAMRLVKNLAALGAKAELITVPGGKHGFPPERWAELYPRIFEFLARAGVRP